MTTPTFNRYAWLAGVCGMLVTSVSYTAPGTIADTPLFTATSSGGGVPSNIMFQLDDSGSMDYDVLTKYYWEACKYGATGTDCTGAGTTNDHTVLQVDGNYNNSGGSVSSSAFTTVNIADWRIRSANMNILYYNPEVTYLPWLNGDGTRMANASFTAAKDDPFSSSTLNLTNFVFEVWTDSHGYSGAAPALSTTSTAAVYGTATGPVTTTSTNYPGYANYTVTLKTMTQTSTTDATVSQTTNRSVGANGYVDWWDNHTTYQVPATGSIIVNNVTYPLALGTPTTATTTVQLSQTEATSPAKHTTNPKTVTLNITNQVTTTSTSLISFAPTLTAVTPTNTGYGSRTLAQEQQNIANWYQYYRRRINVAKGAIGQVVDANPKYRYGVNTIWNKVFVEVPSKYDPATSTTIRTDFVTPNKAMLAALYPRTAANGTPLPDAVERIGKYYNGASIPTVSGGTWSGAAIATSTSSNYVKPIVYECQQNYVILFTDGYWNSDLGTTGSNTTAITGATFAGTGSASSTGDVDHDGHPKTLADVARWYYLADLDSTLINNVPPNGDPDFTDNPAATWQRMVTFTVAFGLQGNLVKGSNGWPDPMLTESGDSKGTTAVETGLWGNPSSANNGEQPDNIDDLWHAAYNGRGLYVSASSPEAVAQGFADILSNISKRDYAGSASAASFNFSSASGSNKAYVSQFGLISNIWTGDLVAFALDATTGLPSTTRSWSAADQLDALNTSANKAAAATSRHIFTYNPALKKGVPFQWANLSAGTIASPTISLAQQDLGTNTSGVITTGTVSAPDPIASARLAYLRGDQTNEGAGYFFRSRSFTDTATPPVKHNNLLGDIIHSDPLLVSTPQGAWPAKSPFYGSTYCSELYKTFKTARSTRAPMVYAGANDGMLHAFNALTGNEAMAYIPNILFSAGSALTGLHYLSDPRYIGQNHRYYVDAPPVVEDVCIDTGSLGARSGLVWHSVLVGGLNEGGRGIYALDITDPTAFNTEDTTNAAKIALWEFDDSDDADMGYSFSVPNIVMMNNNRWAAVFGNGYNNRGTGKAALFIVFLDGGLDGVWTPGTDYLKIMLPTPSSNPYGADSNGSGTCIASTDNCNGLSTPQTIDLNADGVIDRIYAGDLKGQMWTIDVSSSSTGSWGSAYGTTTAPTPLFTASHYQTPYQTYSQTVPPALPTTGSALPVPCGFTAAAPTVITCSSSATFTSRTRQAITSRPTLITNKQSFGYNPPNILVMFGTGQYLNQPDTGNTDMQTYYGVWDHGVGSLTPATAKGSSSTTPAFVEQVYLPGPFMYTPPATTANPTPAAVDISVPNSLNIPPVRVLSSLPVLYSSGNTTNLGWFINMPKDSTVANRAVSVGERQIVNSDILDEKYLFFNTWMPGETSTVTTSSCTVQGNSSGTGYLMSVNLFTGGAADKALFSLAGGASMSTSDSVKSSDGTAFNPAGRAYSTGLPASSSFVKGMQYTPGTNGGASLNGTAVVETFGDQMRRRAWQELRNN